MVRRIDMFSYHEKKVMVVIYGLYAYTRVNVNTKQLLINKDENVHRYEVTGGKIERLSPSRRSHFDSAIVCQSEPVLLTSDSRHDTSISPQEYLRLPEGKSITNRDTAYLKQR